MKALSVRQPYANLIRDGKKTIEVRTWPIKYRGDILIVSTKRPPINPAGFALCIVRIVECRPMRRADKALAHCSVFLGAYAWILDNVRILKPFPVNGKLGIYEVTLPDNIVCHSS